MAEWKWRNGHQRANALELYFNKPLEFSFSDHLQYDWGYRKTPVTQETSLRLVVACIVYFENRHGINYLEPTSTRTMMSYRNTYTKSYCWLIVGVRIRSDATFNVMLQGSASILHWYWSCCLQTQPGPTPRLLTNIKYTLNCVTINYFNYIISADYLNYIISLLGISPQLYSSLCHHHLQLAVIDIHCELGIAGRSEQYYYL